MTTETDIQSTTIRVSKRMAVLLTQAARVSGMSVADYFDRKVRPLILAEYKASLDSHSQQIGREIAKGK